MLHFIRPFKPFGSLTLQDLYQVGLAAPFGVLHSDGRFMGVLRAGESSRQSSSLLGPKTPEKP